METLAPPGVPNAWAYASPQWQERLAAGLAPVDITQGPPLDMAMAGQALAIFDKLRLPDVTGQPRLAEAAGEWQRDIVRVLFGSLDRQTRVRMCPDIFVLVPKKNSKTSGAAAIMLTAVMVNTRPNALFGLFGPTQEVADIAFKAVSGMIEADAGLKKLFHVQDHLKTVTFRRTGALLKVTTFDPAVATGGKYAGWLLDELHLTGRMSYAQRVIGQLRGARIAIPESFGIMITTQSEEQPAGAFKAELDLARKVRDGAVTDVPMLPMLYEFSEEVQTSPARRWRDPAIWPQVTPNLGLSVNLDVLTREYASARAKGDEEERRWASQHLNIEIGLALHVNRWEGADHWERNADPALADLDAFLARCEVVVAGVDGGGLDDLFGLTLLGREAGTARWLTWSRAWADRGVRDLRKDIAGRLDDFERDGDLSFVDLADTPDGARALDVAEIADVIERVHTAGLMPRENAIGLDAVGVSALVDELHARGLPDGLMVAIPQGYRLSGVIKGCARLLKQGGLRHAGQPLMAWCVGNARIEQRGNAVLVTKQVSQGKIDPLIALFNTFDLMSRNPEAPGRSIYEPDHA